MRWHDLSLKHQLLLSSLARGLSNQEIADVRGIAFSTVANGLAEAYGLIGVQNRIGALRWVMEQPESGAYQALIEEPVA